jgi:uncharacterized repeat protein (TIGR01451 family)
VKLTVQTQSGSTTFSGAGEVITYNYVITNTATRPLAGPVSVADDSKSVTCPAVNTVGNLDAYLDLNETITCSAAYTITQADVASASVVNLATANAGGVRSNQAGITLTLGGGQPSGILTLAKTASSQSYGQVGQTITYTYVITNTGTVTLGPAQFTISDNKLAGPFDCGPAIVTLAVNQSLSCSASYTISQADMSLASLTSSATASGAGQTSAAATLTIVNLNSLTSESVTLPASTADSNTPAPPTREPIRIIFATGQTTAAQLGIVNPNETIHYVVTAAAGQVLSVKLTAPANAVAIGVDGPTGLALKALDANPIWSTTINSAGDYSIVIASLADASMSYTLEVSLSPAAGT